MKTARTPEETRRQIVAAAAQLFFERGYEKTSLKDVEAVLEVENGTLACLFSSKTKLLIAVVAHVADEYGRRREFELAASTGDALDKMRILLTPESWSVQDVLVHCHRTRNIKLLAWLLTASAERLAPALGDLIRQGCREGLFRSDHPDETAEFLLVGLQVLTRRGVVSQWDLDDLLRRSEAMPSIIESILNAEPGEFEFLSRAADSTQPANERE